MGSIFEAIDKLAEAKKVAEAAAEAEKAQREAKKVADAAAKEKAAKDAKTAAVAAEKARIEALKPQVNKYFLPNKEVSVYGETDKTLPPFSQKATFPTDFNFAPIDDSTYIISGVLDLYRNLDKQYKEAVAANDLIRSKELLQYINLIQPYIDPLIKTGNDYKKAYEQKNEPELQKLNEDIYRLSGNIISGMEYSSPENESESSTIHANTFTNAAGAAPTLNADIVGKMTEAGAEPWRGVANVNLLDQLEKAIEQNGAYPIPAPVVGQSDLRKASNAIALKNLNEKTTAEDFKNVKTNLGNLYDDDRTALYNSLGKTVGTSPFDTMPAAEGSKLAAAAKRAQQAVTGHVEADAAADQILASKVEPAKPLSNFAQERARRKALAAAAQQKGETAVAPESIASEEPVSSKPTITPQEHTVLEKYLNPYYERVVKHAISDLDKEYNEKVKPAIFTQLSTRPGLQHSGYKDYLLRKAQENYQDRRARTIAELGYKGYESAIGHANEDRNLAIQGLGTVGNQRLSALERAATLPQQQAVAENIDMSTIGNMASQEEALTQAAENSKYEHDKAMQYAPIKKVATVLDALNSMKPATEYIRESVAPVAPRVSPGDMAAQQAVRYGIQHLMGGKAAGGQITQDDDYYDRVRGLMNHYRSKKKPNATKEMLLNSIASMYSGPSKYVSDNVAANMPNALDAYNNAQNSEMDDEIKALELEMGMRKQKQAEEEARLNREDKLFHRNLEKQKLDFEKEKSKAGYKPTVQQQLFNNKILKEGIDDAKGARDVLPKLKALYDAFDKFDTESAKYTKAGDLVTSDLAKSLGSQRLMPDKQRSASQIIEKEKGQLAKAMFSHGLGQALAAKSEEELRKALPGDSLLPEARATILKSLASEVSLKELKNMFNQKWKAINSDMTGADVAFNEYVDVIQPLDERGFLKKGVNNHMDELFKSLKGDQVQSNEYEPSIDEIAQEARERGLIQ